MSSVTTATSAPSNDPAPALTGVRRRLAWRHARVAASIAETATARTLIFEVADDGWAGHSAGQHIDLRLTAPDGYQASRSYSLSSGPHEAPQITVELVEDGEVSPHLVEFVEVGDEIEVRGPIGGYFVWEPTDRPLVLIGGGSGIAPLRSMWRARQETTPTTILYSAQNLGRAIFLDEIIGLGEQSNVETRVHLTRPQDPDEQRVGLNIADFRQGRIDSAALTSAISDRANAAVYVCGPTAFVESVSAELVTLDVDPTTIRTERFG